jgi:hypothetical protein
MRPTSAFAAAFLALGLASAASAKTVAVTPPPPPPPSAETAPPPGLPGLTAPQLPDELTRKTAAEDQAEADATTARLASLDAAAEADEVRMTQLRDWELNLEKWRILAIKPVLPFHGSSYLFPHWY